MADNKLELVVEVDVNRANASIKTVNTGLSSIEQTAAKAARGTSSGIDGMTASMVKGAAAGTLLADSIKHALEWLKEWTIEAARHAANTERLEVVTKALATRHGESADAAMKVVEAVKRIGFTMADAEGAVQKMIIADLSLDKAEGMARVAKDAAAVSTNGLKASEALEQIITAIESGRGRGLRELRIFVDLNKETERAQKLAELQGRTLSENEIIEVRRAAIMREATKLQGAAASQTDSLQAQTQGLSRDVDELREAVGSQFQGLLKEWVVHLRELVGFLKDNSSLVVKFAEGVLVLAGALGTVTVAMKAFKLGAAGLEATLGGLAMLRNVSFAFSNGLTGALVGTEVVLANIARLLPPVAAGLAVWWGGNKLLEHAQGNKQLDTTAEAIKKINARLRETPEWWIQHGMTPPKSRIDTIVDYIKTLDTKKPAAKREPTDAELDRMLADRKTRLEAERASQDYYLRAVEERKSAERDMARARIEDSMKIIEATQSETEAARESLNVVLLSMQERKAGREKILQEEAREIARLSTRVDDKTGVIQHLTLNQSTLETLHRSTAEKLAAFDLRFNEEEDRRIQAMLKASAARSQKLFEQIYVEPMKQQLYVWEQTQGWQEKIDDQARSARLAAVDQRKDLELAQLESIDAVTVQDKLRVEQLKTEIEVRAMKERAQIQIEMLDAQTERDVAAARRAVMAQGIFYEPYLQEIENKVRELGQHEREALQRATSSEIDVAQAKGAASTRKVVVDHYRSIFQSLKEQAGGVFDAMVTKSQSVWSAIGNSLKTALLTGIKDVVTSRVAAVLMQLFTGQKVTFAGAGAGTGGSGGILGGLGGLLGIGAVPAFGSTSPGGVVPGVTPGTTPPFTPGPGGVSSKAGAANLFNFNWSNLKSLASWKNLYSAMTLGGGLMMLSGVQRGSALSTIGGGALMGAGIGLSGGPIGAIGGTGIGLYMDAMRRGGWGGVGEATAGGAMFGWNVGGPLGAAIGAGVGFLSGIVRLFVKGATEKAREKVKNLYGVDISDKAVLQQIVDMAKQTCGGNLDMAIRTQPVRDLIQLYAMSTGQQTKGMPAQMHPLDLVQSGGSLYQSPGYSNGTALPGLGGLPALDTIGGGVASSAQPVVIQLDGPATTSLLRGEAVQAIASNPRVVQTAVMSASKSNAGRRELTSLQLSPGLVTS